MQHFTSVIFNKFTIRIFAGLSVLLLALVLVGLVSAQTLESEDTMMDEQSAEASVESMNTSPLATELMSQSVESFSLPGGPHFMAGDAVQISDNLAGDVFVAGGMVGVTGTVEGDLFAAGGNITITGDVTDDVRVAGGNVTITGNIGKNLTVAGGNVTLSSESSVGKSVIVAGGTLNIDADIADNVLAAGGTVVINGSVGQDVRAEVGLLTVSPDASIGGNLVAKYDTQSDISPAASVAGETQVTQVERTNKAVPPVDVNVDKGDVGKFVFGALLVKYILGVLVGLISGGVLFYLFKNQVMKMSKSTEKTILPALGWGFVYLIGAPIVAVMLMITVLGIPLGFYVMMFWVMDLIAAGWLAAYMLGRQLQLRFKQSMMKSDYVQLLVGLVILQAVYLLPVLGGLIKLVAVLIGLGAIFIWFKDMLKQRDPKKSK